MHLDLREDFLLLGVQALFEEKIHGEFVGECKGVGGVRNQLRLIVQLLANSQKSKVEHHVFLFFGQAIAIFEVLPNLFLVSGGLVGMAWQYFAGLQVVKMAGWWPFDSLANIPELLINFVAVFVSDFR